MTFVTLILSSPRTDRYVGLLVKVSRSYCTCIYCRDTHTHTYTVHTLSVHQSMCEEPRSFVDPCESWHPCDMPAKFDHFHKVFIEFVKYKQYAVFISCLCVYVHQCIILLKTAHLAANHIWMMRREKKNKYVSHAPRTFYMSFVCRPSHIFLTVWLARPWSANSDSGQETVCSRVSNLASLVSSLFSVLSTHIITKDHPLQHDKSREPLPFANPIRLSQKAGAHEQGSCDWPWRWKWGHSHLRLMY